MSNVGLAQKIIRTVTSRNFRAQCPCCEEPISLKEAGLFYLNGFTPKAHDLHSQLIEGLKEQRQELRGQRRHISRSSLVGAKTTNLGFLFEKLAPSLPSFPFRPQDCRVLGMPIDLVVFEGLSRNGRVERILLGDIKTGAARLTDRQKSIKSVVERKRMEWEVYR